MTPLLIHHNYHKPQSSRIFLLCSSCITIQYICKEQEVTIQHILFILFSFFLFNRLHLYIDSLRILRFLHSMQQSYSVLIIGLIMRPWHKNLSLSTTNQNENHSKQTNILAFIYAPFGKRVASLVVQERRAQSQCGHKWLLTRLVTWLYVSN